MTELLQNIKDRALALGLSDKYLDEDNYFYMNGDMLEFHIDHYVAKTDEERIKIPEGIDVVFMNLEDTAYVDGKAYKFVFPSSCIAVYGKDFDCVKGRITLFLNNTKITTFKNSTFDFRKCDKLQTITYGFLAVDVKRILFSDKMTQFGHLAFAYSCIDEVYAAGVHKLGEKCFQSAKIKKLKIGTIDEFEERSLLFSDFAKAQKEVVFKDITHVSVRAIQCIKSVYMGYNYKRFNTDLQTKLYAIADKLQGDIRVVDVFEEYAEYTESLLKSVRSNLEPLYTIENKLYEYKSEVDNKRGELLKEQLLDRVRQFYSFETLDKDRSLYTVNNKEKYKFYLFKDEDDVDVHTRKYECLCNDWILEVYAEL